MDTPYAATCIKPYTGYSWMPYEKNTIYMSKSQNTKDKTHSSQDVEARGSSSTRHSLGHGTRGRARCMHGTCALQTTMVNPCTLHIDIAYRAASPATTHACSHTLTHAYAYSRTPKAKPTSRIPRTEHLSAICSCCDGTAREGAQRAGPHTLTQAAAQSALSSPR